MLVFVGDALEEKIDNLAATAGELGMLGVKVFIFQEGRDPVVERGFREIARLSGGAYARFDVNAAGELRQLLRAAAVYAAGGLKALEGSGAGGRLLLAQIKPHMTAFGVGLVILVVFLLLARAFVAVEAASLVRAIRYTIGAVLIAVGGVLAFGGRIGVGLVIVALGFSAITSGRIGPFDLGGGRRSGGTASVVRSAFLEMRLDHDTGMMNGRVLAGTAAGRNLDDLDEAALLRLREEVAGDGDSLALLEGYLDRRMPGWRENVEGDAAAGPRSTADASAMTDEQAYEILGLAPGAGEAEIRAAHRRLMKRVHPDQGGSTFLAAKINQAKDWLLGRHR